MLHRPQRRGSSPTPRRHRRGRCSHLITARHPPTPTDQTLSLPYGGGSIDGRKQCRRRRQSRCPPAARAITSHGGSSTYAASARLLVSTAVRSQLTCSHQCQYRLDCAPAQELPHAGAAAQRRPHHGHVSFAGLIPADNRVPLYACSSLIALYSLNAAFYIDAIRDLYEVSWPREVSTQYTGPGRTDRDLHQRSIFLDTGCPKRADELTSGLRHLRLPPAAHYVPWR